VVVARDRGRVNATSRKACLTPTLSRRTGEGAGSGPLSRPIRSLSPSAGEVRVRGLPPQCARNRSASIAAMQPVPAAVTAWR
jgi:hypothetical protein